MASIGKIAASAVSIPNELTVAAAAFNIDFSLLKIEAPHEFNGLRQALSPRRIKNAEDGQHHITARQLGALFEARLPQVPDLISAYGKRVSEICSQLDQDPQTHPQTGLFAGYAGLDGLNIWAGATSGSGALAAHLLACLLARIWKPYEAISLWVEIVERRRQEILEAFSATSTIEAAALMAAQQIISRQQLAAWDASARSWLHTADGVKKAQHIQLNLIINNINLSVNTNRDPFKSVMDTWTSAMKAMDLLVQGVPQRANNAAILLAMSSWHLYADMEVLLQETKSVDQHDALLRGSVVTISCESCASNQSGVSWSLPLSRMRFYSAPVQTKRQLALDSNRVTMPEFWIVVLGATIESWLPMGYRPDDVCRFISFLARKIGALTPAWLAMLATAANKYLQATGAEKQQYHKLLGLGKRRGRDFMLERNVPPSLSLPFGDIRALLNMKIEEKSHPEATEFRIKTLRAVAHRLVSDPEDFIILYPRSKFSVEPKQANETVYEYASMCPQPRSSSKRTQDGKTKPASRHCRWVILYRDEQQPASMWNCSWQSPCSCIERSEFFENLECPSGKHCRDHCSREASATNKYYPLSCCCGNCSNPAMPWNSPSIEGSHQSLGGGSEPKKYSQDQSTSSSAAYFRRYPAARSRSKDTMLQKVSDKTIHQENNHPTPCAGWLNERGMRNIENIGEDCYGFHPDAVFIGDWWEQIMLRKPDLLEDVTYEYFINMAGDLTLLRRARDSPPLPPDVNQLPIEVVEMILSDATVSAEDTLRWLQQVLPVSLINPLIAMSFAGLTYSNLSGATVSMGVLSKPLHSVHWARQIYSFYPQSLKMQEMFWVNQPGRGEWDYIRHETERLATTLACIAMFDSGEFDVEPMRLPGVFALSSGDSIFVATSLTTDPSERPGGPLVKRVLGNLGRPEMAFIVPASNPLLGGCDLASWHMVNHDLFDGSFKDSFKGTSLHLTLTGFEMFLDMGLGGLRDRQVVMLESVISLHDRGKHLGDLDILRSFGHPNLAIGCNCEHHREFDEHGSSPSDDDSSKVSPELHDLVAIDCWDEFFDFPSNTAIIRVCGNWEAQWQRA